MKALLALCLSLAALAAHGQERALLLVASPELQGVYARTTLLVVPAGDTHIGFILNRATDVKMASLFPGHAPSQQVADPVYFGGPEMVESIFAVVGRNPGEPSLHLFGELFVTGTATHVDSIIEKTPNEARYFAGFVGWRPGELQRELRAGYWFTAEPDAAQVFRKDTGAMWEELVQRHRPPRKGELRI